MKEVEMKSNEIKSFVDYRFKDEDYDYIVAEKKRFAKDTDKMVERKLNLLKEREDAVQQNDTERVKEIDQLIEEIDEKAIDINSKRTGNFNMLA